MIGRSMASITAMIESPSRPSNIPYSCCTMTVVSSFERPLRTGRHETALVNQGTDNGSIRHLGFNANAHHADIEAAVNEAAGECGAKGRNTAGRRWVRPKSLRLNGCAAQPSFASVHPRAISQRAVSFAILIDERYQKSSPRHRSKQIKKSWESHALKVGGRHGYLWAQETSSRTATTLLSSGLS